LKIVHYQLKIENRLCLIVTFYDTSPSLFNLFLSKLH